MGHYDFRRLAEIVPNGKCDPRAIVPLEKSGLIAVGTLVGGVELYDPIGAGGAGSDEMTELNQIAKVQVKSPVLQLKPFTHGPNMELDTLVVLCSRKLIGVKCVATNSVDGAADDQKQQYDLRYIFEHKLNVDYYSVDCGGADGHEVKSDLIFALAMNGELSVFQNETRVFQVHMPDMLFPSPLVYSPSADAIYIQSGAMVISSFAQNNLAIMAESQKTKFASQWSTALPELVLDLVLVESKATLFALGTQSVFIIRIDNGQVARHVHLEGVRIRAMEPYVTESGSLMQLYATECDELIVYKGTQRVWSCSTNMDVTSVRRCGGAGSALQGALLLLDRVFTIRIGFLGTRAAVRQLEQLPETRATMAELGKQLEQVEAALEGDAMAASSDAEDKSIKNAFSLGVILNPSLRKKHTIETKVQVGGGMDEMEHVSVGIVGPNDAFDVEINENQSGDNNLSTGRDVEATVSVPNKAFLNLNLDVVASAKTASDEHQVQLITEQLPLTAWLTKIDDVSTLAKLSFGIALCSTRAISVASLFSEYSLHADNDKNEVAFHLPNNASQVHIRGDAKTGQLIECDASNLNTLLLIVKLIATRAAKNQDLTVTADNAKMENRIFSHFQTRMEQLGEYAATRTQLAERLNQQMKFLTALEKRLLTMAQLKDQLKNDTMIYLVQETVESIKALRRALIDTDQAQNECELEVMASIEMIMLIAFTKHAQLKPVLKLLQVLEQRSSGTPFLEQMEAKLNYIGQRFGSPPAAIAPTQVDSSRLIKKMKQILSKLSAPLLQSLFAPPDSTTVRSVPVKQAEPKPELKPKLKPELGPMADTGRNLKPIAKASEPEQQTTLAPLKKVRETRPKPPEDFAEHMKLLSK